MRLTLALALLIACGRAEPQPDCTPKPCTSSSLQPACLNGNTHGGICEDGFTFVVDCSSGERALYCVTDAGS